MRLRIDIAYDGTAFSGWAVQPRLRTVQGEVERIIATLLREPARLTVAGRTDAGVHAAHQVCHVDVKPSALERCVGHMAATPVDAFARRLGYMLPEDIALLRVSEAPEGFDARFSALERRYCYRISDATCVPDPRLRRMVLRMGSALDMNAMNEAAHAMLGLHDFGSFATPNPQGTTIREVKAASWQREELLSGREALCFTIVADAFARNMVRSLVGACVRVGEGKRSLTWFQEKMRVPLREGETGPIAPQGLTLEHVAYPSADLLAVRAAHIRAKRTLPSEPLEAPEPPEPPEA